MNISHIFIFIYFSFKKERKKGCFIYWVFLQPIGYCPWVNQLGILSSSSTMWTPQCFHASIDSHYHHFLQPSSHHCYCHLFLSQTHSTFGFPKISLTKHLIYFPYLASISLLVWSTKCTVLSSLGINLNP